MTEPIAFEVVGNGAPVVLVHGDFANGRLAWSRQIDTLSGQYRLIIVDRRGNGRSPRAEHYTIAGDAADILAAAAQIGTDSFHLVGQSYGGVVALEIARRRPSAILTLHLIEPPLLGLLPDDSDASSMSKLIQPLFTSQRRLDPEEVASTFFRALVGSDGLVSLRTHKAWPRLVAEAERFTRAESPGLYEAAAIREIALKVPIQVYTGGRSHPGLQKIARQLVTILPGAALVEIPEAAHDVQRAHEAFNAAFRAAVQAVDPSESH
ncbi:MAG TPA: alpha/beta hydrolase [Chloroflexota bacterium]|nr:alpha/beta hydrolase [Chloroflexota bacterium]